MYIEQAVGATSAKASIWNIRYHDIQADRFLWNGDYSSDGGKAGVRTASQSKRTGLEPRDR